MPAYRLHCFPESGNCYKVALMLTLCGQDFEPLWVDYFSGATRTAEWRASVNEMGEVPVLEVDGAPMTQSAPILLRLAEMYGRFGAPSGSHQNELLRWLFWDNHKLTSYMGTYRFLRAFARAADPAVLAFFRSRVDVALAVVERHLEHNYFVLGPDITVADLSMCGYLFYPAEETGYNLEDAYPAVAAWLRRIAATPRWAPPYDLLPGLRYRNQPSG